MDVLGNVIVMDSRKSWPSLAVVHPFTAMVWQFHDDMQARVQNDGEFSEPFEVTNGVRQGCVMAPTLFSIMFFVMLMDAFQDGDTGFQSGTVLMVIYSTLEGCKPKLRCRLMC